MAEDAGYLGWTNRETWIVNLWLTNEEQTYFAARDMLKALPDHKTLGDALEAFVDEMVDESEAKGFMLDLLTAALARVNWVEAAASLVAE